jgi:hypothetical protein
VQRAAKLLGYSRYGVYIRWLRMGLPSNKHAERQRKDLDLVRKIRNIVRESTTHAS